MKHNQKRSSILNKIRRAGSIVKNTAVGAAKGAGIVAGTLATPIYIGGRIGYEKGKRTRFNSVEDYTADFQYVDNNSPKRAKYKAKVEARKQQLYDNPNTRQAYLDKQDKLSKHIKNRAKVKNFILPGATPLPNLNTVGSAKGNVNLNPYQKLIRKVAKTYKNATPETKLGMSLIGSALAMGGVGLATSAISKSIPNKVKSEVIVRKESRDERKTREDKGKRRREYRKRMIKYRKRILGG